MENDPIQTEPVEKTYSQSELDKIINKAVETNTKNMEKKYSSIIEREKTDAAREAEKLAKMTAAEKERAKFDKEKAEFEAQMREFNQLKLETECTRVLHENGLPIEFSKYLTAGDAESTKANIDEFSELFTAAIESAVANKLKKENKPGMGNTNPGAITPSNMSITERLEFFKKNNPGL